MPEPLNRVEFSLTDFDRSQLPLPQRTLQGEAFRKAVQTHFENEYAPIGGFAEIVVTETLVSIRWKKEGDQPDMVVAAIGCLTKGDYQRGVAMLRFARKSRGDDFRVLFNLGMALSDKAEFDEAVDCLEHATRVEPNDPRGWTALGVAYARMGRVDDARRVLEEAVRRDSQDPYALRNLGAIVLRQRGEEKRARDLLMKATSLAPSDAQAWVGLGRAHEALSELSEADAAYLKVIELVTDGPVADEAKKGRGRIAEANFRLRAGKGVRMDAVMYCAGALRTFRAMTPEEVKKVAVEIAILGTRGLNVNDPAERYQLRSLPGSFSGLHLLCIEYVGFKLTQPDLDIQFDLSAEYAMAKEMFSSNDPTG